MVTDADRCICWGEDCPKHGIDIVDGMVVYRDAAARLGGVLPSNPSNDNDGRALRLQAIAAHERGDTIGERQALDALALIEREQERPPGRSNDEPTDDLEAEIRKVINWPDGGDAVVYPMVDFVRARLEAVTTELDDWQATAAMRYGMVTSARSSYNKLATIAQGYLDRAEAAEAETLRLREMKHRVETVHVWTNEDGKRFVLADDLLAAVLGGTET